jgi:predicted porin
MFNLAAGMSGVYGQKAIMRDANTPTTTTRGRWSQVQDDGWLAEAFFMIPIIPERNMNKAGALLFYANAMTGQGLTPYSPQLFPAAYARTGSAGTARDYAAPKGKAWDVGFMVYLSDTVWLSPSYNDMSTMLSSRYRTFVATDTTVKRTQNYNLFLGYAPTPALTLGLEYTRIITNYARYSLTSTTPDGLKNWGTANAVRFGAYYYF